MWAAGAVAAMSSITFPAVSALVSRTADADQQGRFCPAPLHSSQSPGRTDAPGCLHRAWHAAAHTPKHGSENVKIQVTWKWQDMRLAQRENIPQVSNSSKIFSKLNMLFIFLTFDTSLLSCPGCIWCLLSCVRQPEQGYCYVPLSEAAQRGKHYSVPAGRWGKNLTTL